MCRGTSVSGLVIMDESCSAEMKASVVTDCVMCNKTRLPQRRAYGHVSQRSVCENTGQFHVEITLSFIPSGAQQHETSRRGEEIPGLR